MSQARGDKAMDIFALAEIILIATASCKSVDDPLQ
jgi:hypothetical protein